MVSLGVVPPLSFVVGVRCGVSALQYELIMELCVGADNVSEARELFAEFVARHSSPDFPLVLEGEVMNTFEQFGRFVHFRECK